MQVSPRASHHEVLAQLSASLNPVDACPPHTARGGGQASTQPRQPTQPEDDSPTASMFTAERALRNSECSHQLARGSASRKQVAASPAGIEGWGDSQSPGAQHPVSPPSDALALSSSSLSTSSLLTSTSSLPSASASMKTSAPPAPAGSAVLQPSALATRPSSATSAASAATSAASAATSAASVAASAAASAATAAASAATAATYAATPAAAPAATYATSSAAFSDAADVSAPPSTIQLHRQLPRLPLPAGAPSSSLSAFGRLAELGSYLSLDGLEPLSSAAPVGLGLGTVRVRVRVRVRVGVRVSCTLTPAAP